MDCTIQVALFYGNCHECAQPPADHAALLGLAALPASELILPVVAREGKRLRWFVGKGAHIRPFPLATAAMAA
jgi:hypothetical protein